MTFLLTAARERVPSLDVSEASPVRWIFDAVAELHAQANLAYDRAIDWDVNSKTGQELDDFVENFGMQRKPGRHATGTVTLLFGAPTTRPYLLKQGTELYTKQISNFARKTFVIASDTAIPRLSSFATLPVIASDVGGGFNVRANEINELDEEIEHLVNVRNEDPMVGGKGEETDGELQQRFRTDLFRDILGNEAWYRQIASRHPQVSAVQLIRPTQDAEEHLKIVDGSASCTEDSLKYTYSNLFSVYVPRTDEWLTQERDFTVTIDNETPSPPVIDFISNYQEGDSIIVRYQYCSKKSRNNPVSNDMRFLDLYVTGNSPSPTIDFSTWNENNIIGAYNVNKETHPDSVNGRPYYIFVKQPVYDVSSEIDIQGRRYYRGKDYELVKDKTVQQNSGHAKDILQWNSTLPEDRFEVPYFHNLVISDIQGVVDEPDMHTAIDDVLIHSSEEIEFDIDITVEWNRGRENEEDVKEVISNFFTEVEMGSRIRYGELMKALSNVPKVDAVFLNEISSDTIIRSKRSWKTDVPLPDGTVPKLRNLTVQTTAQNIY